MLPYIIAVICVLVVYLFYFRKRKNDILITGLCDSGKTVVFNQLIYGNAKNTFTSLRENIANLVLKNGERFRLIDIPGHHKTRMSYLETRAPAARAVIFVLDAKTIKDDIINVAEYVFNLYTNASLRRNKIRVLIVCNKQDIPMAKSAKFARELLEKELDLLKVADSKYLKLHGDAAVNKLPLCAQETKFNFDSPSNPLKTEFIECSATLNVTAIKEWAAHL